MNVFDDVKCLRDFHFYVILDENLPIAPIVHTINILWKLLTNFFTVSFTVSQKQWKYTTRDITFTANKKRVET